MLKSLVLLSGLSVLPCLGLSAATVTFQSGVGNCGVMNNLDTFTNQCAAANVLGVDAYYYVDFRDTFDGQGIANQAIVGKLLFPNPVSNLSMDYVIFFGDMEVSFEIFDSSDNSLGSFSDPHTGEKAKNGSFVWGGAGIAKLIFRSNRAGFVGITTLRFDDVSAVPEPATFALAGVALAGAAFWRRRVSRSRQ